SRSAGGGSADALPIPTAATDKHNEESQGLVVRMIGLVSVQSPLRDRIIRNSCTARRTRSWRSRYAWRADSSAFRNDDCLTDCRARIADRVSSRSGARPLHTYKVA